MKNRIILFTGLVVFSIVGLAYPSISRGGEETVLKLTSPAFENGGMIPPKYTCDGEDVSPPLEWGVAPEGAKSFALVCDDPDAPMGTWVHWVIYNIPQKTKSLMEDIAREAQPAAGGMQGTNDFHKIGYGGPCPPGGTHRYYFRLYALDFMPDMAPGVTKRQLLKEIEGHIVGQTELMGKYKR
ncbi:conserved hypothetical protein [uncultured Desulfobacterium sp.]|uniref:YbhB/YbcL family Raf kinase inhibitor-like protein n=1 Tax=uncultured Desulfobacterium sp. TaxID=201089 RepID=A0A445MVX4_9BACT|nr:conserved hypothetical protein [uncultured Desulfobacterium sp.]